VEIWFLKTAEAFLKELPMPSLVRQLVVEKTQTFFLAALVGGSLSSARSLTAQTKSDIFDLTLATLNATQFFLWLQTTWELTTL